MKLKAFRTMNEDGEVRLFLHKSTIEIDDDKVYLDKVCLDELESELLDTVNTVAYNRSGLLYEGASCAEDGYDIKFSTQPLDCVNVQKVYNLNKDTGREKLLNTFKSFAWADFENLFNQAVQLGHMKVATHLE